MPGLKAIDKGIVALLVNALPDRGDLRSKAAKVEAHLAGSKEPYLRTCNTGKVVDIAAPNMYLHPNTFYVIIVSGCMKQFP